ncbi:MAG: DUF1566 domain-containing protein [Candidatus Riflebacteria bacterium]|nr:DUF1566 domain-containing protein [Candidatus Riflebacteria bacterium]
MRIRNKLSILFLSTIFVTILAGITFAATPATDPTAAYLEELYGGARFSRNVDGIISDRQTGLQWLEGPDTDISWKDGQKWIKKISDGWRTPEIAELKSLFVANAGGSASKNLDPVFHITGSHIWSVKGIDPGSMFWPQHGYLYYNYNVSNGGSSEFTKGSRSGIRVVAVRSIRASL